MTRPNPDIDDLLNKYASDKHSQNGYAPIYHGLFKHLRDAPISMLEIGIGTMLPNVYCSMYGHDLPGYRPGASLRAWRDYFAHPDSTIHGMDVQPDTMITDEPKITTHLCNSTDLSALRDALVYAHRFDIILDDGSHIAEQQFLTLQNLWPFLKRNGLYVIEDVNRVDHNQGRILVDLKAPFDEWAREVDALYFTATFPKADVIVISARD